jgi:hypothetical protein
MKKIALALLFVFATGSAVAQTYACQFIMTAGMKKDQKSGWKVTNFQVDEPFFLTMSNGLIDTNSVTKPPLKLSTFSVSCNKYAVSVVGVVHWCADYSDYLSFNENTLNGGFATTMGAMQPSNDTDVDSVSIARFKCQKVR